MDVGGQHAEQQAVHREEQQAADDQVPQRDAPGDAEIGRHPDEHEERDRDVGVRQQQRAELVEEQGVSDRLARHEAADDQEQVREEEEASLQFSGTEVEEAFEATEHRGLGAATGRGAGRV